MKNGDYILVIVPDDYPGKRYRGKYAYEHHAVYWRKHGRLPDRSLKEVIHHKNGDKKDNRIEKLELLSHQEHMLHHGKGVSMIERVCEWCGKAFSREKRKADYGRYFCGRSHQVSAQQRDLKLARSLMGKMPDCYSGDAGSKPAKPAI